MTHGDPWKDGNRQGFKVDHLQIYWQLENLAPFNLFSYACQKRSIALKRCVPYMFCLPSQLASRW